VSGTLGLLGLLFALAMGGTLAWFMLDGDRKQHRRQMEALQRRIEKREADKAAAPSASKDDGPTAGDK